MEEFLQDAERLAAAEEGEEDEDAAGLLGAGQLLHVSLQNNKILSVAVLTLRIKGRCLHAFYNLLMLIGALDVERLCTQWLCIFL